MLMQNLGWQTKSIMVCYGIFWSVQKKWGWRWPCFDWNPYCFWNVNHALLYFCLLLSLLSYYFVFMFLGILMRFLSKEGHCLPRSHSKARFLSTPYSNVFHRTSPVLCSYAASVESWECLFSVFPESFDQRPSGAWEWSWVLRKLFSHDVTAAMLVSQTNPVGVQLFSYANAFFFVPIKLHRCLPREWSLLFSRVALLARSLACLEV